MNKNGTKNQKKCNFNGNSLCTHSNPALTTLTEESGLKGLAGCVSEAPFVKCPSTKPPPAAVCVFSTEQEVAACVALDVAKMSHQSYLVMGRITLAKCSSHICISKNCSLKYIFKTLLVFYCSCCECGRVQVKTCSTLSWRHCRKVLVAFSAHLGLMLFPYARYFQSRVTHFIVDELSTSCICFQWKRSLFSHRRVDF